MADRTVNIHEAKTHLSRLVEQVEAGDEVVIARAGRPVARLVAFHVRTKPRVPGLWKGKVHMAPDFDIPDDDLTATFEQANRLDAVIATRDTAFAAYGVDTLSA